MKASMATDDVERLHLWSAAANDPAELPYPRKCGIQTSFRGRLSGGQCAGRFTSPDRRVAASPWA
jgi:hypothetical protein